MGEHVEIGASYYVVDTSMFARSYRRHNGDEVFLNKDDKVPLSISDFIEQNPGVVGRVLLASGNLPLAISGASDLRFGSEELLVSTMDGLHMAGEVEKDWKLPRIKRFLGRITTREPLGFKPRKSVNRGLDC